MLPGLNSNIKQDDKMFHIQTEDSGMKYCHIISHLFEGGRILASEKTEYKDLVENSDLEKNELEMQILKKMRQSHRKMIAKLNAGAFELELADDIEASQEDNAPEITTNKEQELPALSDDTAQSKVEYEEEINLDIDDEDTTAVTTDEMSSLLEEIDDNDFDDDEEQLIASDNDLPSASEIAGIISKASSEQTKFKSVKEIVHELLG